MFNLLAAGVSPKWLDKARESGLDVGEANDGSKIKEAAAKLMTDVKALQDTNFMPYFFDFDDEGNDEKFLEVLRSKKWNGIALGGGVRTIPHLSDTFTKVVNLIIKEQPDATLVFPLTPGDVVPQFKRYLPGLA